MPSIPNFMEYAYLIYDNPIFFSVNHLHLLYHHIYLQIPLLYITNLVYDQKMPIYTE
jgi:hypothetical protein